RSGLTERLISGGGGRTGGLGGKEDIVHVGNAGAKNGFRSEAGDAPVKEGSLSISRAENPGARIRLPYAFPGSRAPHLQLHLGLLSLRTLLEVHEEAEHIGAAGYPDAQPVPPHKNPRAPPAPSGSSSNPKTHQRNAGAAQDDQQRYLPDDAGDQALAERRPGRGCKNRGPRGDEDIRAGFGKRIENIHEMYDGLLETIISQRQEERHKIKDTSSSSGAGTTKYEAKDFLDLIFDVMEDDTAEEINGDHALDLTELPGLTAPRAQELVCIPVERVPINMILELIALIIALLSFIITLFQIRKRRRRLPPGPIGLPIVGHIHLLQPLLHRSFQDFTSRYGPLVYLRLGSVPCLVVSSPELVKELLRTQETNFSSRMATSAVELITKNLTSSFAPYGPYYKFMRRLATTQLLGSRVLDQLLPIRRAELRDLLLLLHHSSQVGEPVNVTQGLHKMTNNILSQMVMGIKSSGTDRQAEFIRSVVRELEKIFGEFNVSDFIWFLKSWDLQGIGKRSRKVADKASKFMEPIITERQQLRQKIKGSGDHYESKDFLDLLLDVMGDDTAEIKINKDHVTQMAFMILELLSLFAAFLFILIRIKQRRKLPPGPIGLPIVGHLHLIGPIIHRSFQKFTSRHGPLVYLRLGSVPCVVVSSPELAKQVYKTQEINFASRFRTIAVDRTTYDATIAFAPYESPYWGFMKKLTTQELLGTRMLDHFHPIRTRELHEFLTVLFQNSTLGGRVNMAEELVKMTFNNITQMMIGIRASEQDGRAEVAKSVVRDLTKIYGDFNMSDFIWLFKNFDLQGFGKRFEQILQKGDSLLEPIITEHQEERQKIKSSGEKYEARNFLDLMFDCMEDETSEIKVTRDHIKGLVMSFSPKDSYLATKKAKLVALWTLIKGQHFELLPFGTGRRSCPGISLAMQQVPITVAAMIQCFDWKIPGDNALDMTEGPGLSSPRAHDLVCVPVAMESMRPIALPVIGHLHLIGPLIHQSFRDLSSIYGPLIHLKLSSVSCVVASTPELAKELLKTHELTFSSRNQTLATDRLTSHSSFTFAPYGPYWKLIKKMSTCELLSNRMLSQFVPIRTNELHRFLQVLSSKSKVGESVNVTQELIKLSNNIISRMMLGIRSSGTDSQSEVARTLVRQVTQIIGEFNVSDYIWFCKNLDLQGFRKRIEGIHCRYDGLLEEIIRDREQVRKQNKSKGEANEVKDFLDVMLDVMENEDDELKLKRKNVKALILEFFTAGTDTMAISVEWALAELINHSEVLEKARREIKEVVGNKGRLIQESDGPNLPYIQAIIKETLRLHPPIPMLPRKSSQDCKIAGYTIPANSLLFVNIWSIGRDPRYWENPLEFLPERFLPCNQDSKTSFMDIRGQHFELLPFGTGRRSCPGISLAMLQVPITVAAMIQCFDWKIPGDNALDMTEGPGLSAPRAHDLVCVPVAMESMPNVLGPIPLPIIGHLHLIGPLIHQSFRDLSSIYGPLIHLKLGSVSCVVASTPELAKELLKTHELTFSSRNQTLAIDRLTYHSSFAFAPYGPYWKFIKKMSTFELLSNRMLRQLVPIRTTELHRFLQVLYSKSKVGESVNVTQELIKLSNNIISQMMLGIRSSGTESQSELAGTLVRQVMQIFGELNVSDYIWFCKNLDLQGFKKRIEEIHSRYDRLLEEIIGDREQVREQNKSKGEANEVKDFLDVMLDAMENEDVELKLKRENVKALILDFFTAGTDTMAISVEWALAELINHPEVLEKARKEIKEVMGNNNRLIQESDGPNLPYIQAITKETLRLHPPVPMLPRKSSQDCKIAGYTIPANSLLFVNIWSIGRDPRYWKNPLEFRPERFLPCNQESKSSSMDIRGQHFELLPFGSGRRSCPGISLAMQHVPITVAAMIQCFDWKISDDNVLDMAERPGLTAPRLHDLVCIPVAMESMLNGPGLSAPRAHDLVCIPVAKENMPDVLVSFDRKDSYNLTMKAKIALWTSEASILSCPFGTGRRSCPGISLAMQQFPITLLCFATLALLLHALRRKRKQYLHPLPPGPIALPIIGHLHLLGPLIHHTFRDFSSLYGPLIHLKLGYVSCVVASTPELAQELLKTHELTFSSRKHSLAIDRLTYHSSFAFAPYGPYWKFIKKMSAFELLSNRMLTQSVPIRTNELHRFLQDLYCKSKVGETVNVTQELIKLSNNIISRMMLGIRSSGTDSQSEVARTVVRQVTQIFGEFNVSDYIWFCKNLDLQGFRKRIEDIHCRYDGLLEEIIRDREQVRKQNKSKGEANQVKDFLDVMLDVMENEDAEFKLKRENVKALILDFFTAGTDTTAITVEWALAELINHPEVLEKARKEIKEVAGNNNRLIQESDGPNLPYIHAIIKETFRLHPPIPMISRKSIEDCKVAGYTIPANSLLFVNIWSIGRDPKYWESPLEFRPERFLSCNQESRTGGSSMDIRGQHFELLPFGTGRRSCPGISLAMQQVPNTVAAMIQCFDWKIADDNGLDMTERPGLTAPRAHDLVCVPVAMESMLSHHPL
ncbi:hypothetical protein Tsubulata_023807, partial [Turnera subulata]